MAWVKIDDHFDEHPKLAKVGPIGWGVWLAGLAYCNRNLTDGFIPHSVAESIGGRWRVWETGEDGRERVTQIARTTGMSGEDMDTDWVIGLLLDAGLWDTAEGGYRIHDYTDYQPTRAEVEAERAQTAARVQRFRSNAKRNGVGNGVTNGVSNVGETPAPVPVPDPIPETPDGSGTNVPSPSSSAAAGAPPTKKARQPRKTPEPEPDDLELARLLATLMRRNNPRVRITAQQGPKWADEVRLMRTADGRTLEEIRAIIEWSQKDRFWRGNVLSMGAVREHFDAMTLKMNTPDPRASPTRDPEVGRLDTDDVRRELGLA